MSTFKQHKGDKIVSLSCLQLFLFSNNIRIFPKIKKIDNNVNVTVVNNAPFLFLICQIT